MKKSLEQIEDKDSILLMYLSDELSPEERAQVDQMLAADPALAGRLEAMTQLHQFFTKVMGSLDESEPAEPSQSALRGPMRLLRKYALERGRPAPVEVVTHSIPWMRYGFSVAAAMLVGCLIWWNVHPAPTSVRVSSPLARSVNTSQQPMETPSDSATMALLVDTMSTNDDASQVIAAADSRADETDFASDALQAAQSDE